MQLKNEHYDNFLIEKNNLSTGSYRPIENHCASPLFLDKIIE